jgi:L-aminopeptidase/D-esterase-like protein
MKRFNAITDVPGIEVGQANDEQAMTGCTVVLCRKGAVGGVDVRGSAPGTRETDLLDPVSLVDQVHAVVLAGGSAFGLDAASGVMKYLEEKKIGFSAGKARVPIVPAAILFDLGLGKSKRHPDAEMGYKAAAAAGSGKVAEGNVGKIFGLAGAMKAGLGTASLEAGAGILVGAIVAVNAFGDVLDPQTGAIVAGARPVKVGPARLGGSGQFADTLQVMKSFAGRTALGFATGSNTVIGVVATNAKFTKAEATKMAQMAQDGLARVVRPAHTMLDGDTVFALATGGKKADVSTVGAYAAEALAQAILRAVRAAWAAGGLPAPSNEPAGSSRRSGGRGPAAGKPSDF